VKSADLAGLAGIALSATGIAAALKGSLSRSRSRPIPTVGERISVHRRTVAQLSAVSSALVLTGESSAARRFTTEDHYHRIERAVQVGVRKSRVTQGRGCPRVRAVPNRDQAYINNLYDKATDTINVDFVKDWT